MSFNIDEYKKQLVDIASENINHEVNRIFYNLKNVDIDKVNVGKVEVTEDYPIRQNCEVAAWHTDYDVKSGEYDLSGNIVDGKIHLFFDAKAVMTDDYTPALFGGVKVGEDTTSQDIGKESTRMEGIPIYNLDNLAKPFKVKLDTELYIPKQVDGRSTLEINFKHPSVVEVMNLKADVAKYSAFNTFLESVVYLRNEKHGRVDYDDLEKNNISNGNARYDLIAKTLNEFKSRIDRELVNFKKAPTIVPLSKLKR
jgi:hypothetical protein